MQAEIIDSMSRRTAYQNSNLCSSKIQQQQKETSAINNVKMSPALARYIISIQKYKDIATLNTLAQMRIRTGSVSVSSSSVLLKRWHNEKDFNKWLRVGFVSNGS